MPTARGHCREHGGDSSTARGRTGSGPGIGGQIQFTAAISASPGAAAAEYHAGESAGTKRFPEVFSAMVHS